MLRPTANISWIDGQPQSLDFEDVYFQVDEGLNESHHVFLKPNLVTERLKKPAHQADCLKITEAGFGSGLNFIACYTEWLNLPEPKKHLEFTSIEGFPLTREDLMRAAEFWPDLEEAYSQLISSYPSPIEGAHLLQFEQGRVRLRLVFKPIKQAIEEHSLPSDIWFLDGFTPSRNSDMWHEQLFTYIAYHSNPETTLSTFTSASVIRRALENNGFRVTKLSGFGPKREMISAHFTGNLQPPKPLPLQPWHISQAVETRTITGKKDKPIQDVAVIGAGIAGLVTALTFVRKGYTVQLIEKESTALAGASSQPILIMYGKLPKKPCAESDLLIHSQLEAQRFYTYEQSLSKTKFWHSCGVAQLAWNEQEKHKQAMIDENYDLPSDFIQTIPSQSVSTKSGLTINAPATFFPNAGWLDTQRFAEHVLRQPGITFIPNNEVISLEQVNDSRTWILHTHQRKPLKSDCVIICNAFDAVKLAPELNLPLKPLRGQTTQLAAEALCAPKVVLCGEGYLCPEHQGQIHFGATYDLGNSSVESKREDDLQNIEQIQEWLPEWHTQSQLTESIQGSEAGLRTTTNDYTPIVGGYPEIQQFSARLSELSNNAKGEKDTLGTYTENLFLNVGYGSKGLTFSPASADLISTQVADSATGHSHAMRKQLAPARFVIRNLKKGQRYKLP